jgi:hypothetical protein
MTSKDKAVAKWPREEVGLPGRVDRFLATFPTLEKLREFWDDTRNLTWPETYGTSPWEFAGSVAYQIFNDHGRRPIPALLDKLQANRDAGLAVFYGDLVHAIRAIELDTILDGDMAPNFAVAAFRALSQRVHAGTAPVMLADGTTSTHEVRYCAFEQTGLYLEKAPFFGVLPEQGSDLVSGDLLVYAGTYPQDAMIKPLLAIPMAQLLRGTQTPNLDELARIFRHEGGKGGYAWGDTRGSDGNRGAETLTHLVLLGLARRTGGDRPNQLGGSWPEVELTSAGMRAVIASGKLLDMQRVAPRPVASARGSWGEFDFDAQTGAVLGPLYGEGVTDAEFDHDTAPVLIDIDELKSTYPDEEIAGQSYDVLDLGFTTAGGALAEPDEDWREEFREGARRLRI